MTILVFYIDDEPILCENFQDQFESDNVVIKTFIDPALAIEEAKKSVPDLCFIDYRFPNATGEDVAKSLPNESSKVLVTGDLNIISSEDFSFILTKPVSSEDISKILDFQLKKSS